MTCLKMRKDYVHDLKDCRVLNNPDLEKTTGVVQYLGSLLLNRCHRYNSGAL